MQHQVMTSDTSHQYRSEQLADTPPLGHPVLLLEGVLRSIRLYTSPRPAHLLRVIVERQRMPQSWLYVRFAMVFDTEHMTISSQSISVKAVTPSMVKTSIRDYYT